MIKRGKEKAAIFFIVAIVVLVVVIITISFFKIRVAEKEVDGKLAQENPNGASGTYVLPIEVDPNPDYESVYEIRYNIDQSSINPGSKAFAARSCPPVGCFIVTLDDEGVINDGCVEWIGSEATGLSRYATEVNYELICNDSVVVTPESFSNELIDGNPPVITCGNGACDVNEDCNNCPGDCGCNPGETCTAEGFCSVCGNGVCDAGKGENCNTCRVDCKCGTGYCCEFDGVCFPTGSPDYVC